MSSPNENVALGAAKVILSKTLPDLKSETHVEVNPLSNEEQQSGNTDDQVRNALKKMSELGIDIPRLWLEATAS
jgi:hypothetical protein